MPFATDQSVFFLPLFNEGSAAEKAVSQRRPGPAEESLFVGDASNELLRLLQDLNSIESSFWPLTLYGPPLTGKSALVQSLVLRWARRRRSGDRRSSALFITAPELARQLSDAVETNSVSEHRSILLRSSAVGIDDLQKIQSSAFAQSQLIVLLESWRRLGTPVAFTLDSLPVFGSSWSDQLVSRLLEGLVIPVRYPGKQARRQIVRSQINQLGLEASDEALDWVASSPRANNARSLRSLSVEIKCKLSGRSTAKPVSLEDVQSFSVPTLDIDSDKFIELVVAATAHHFQLAKKELLGNSRRQTTVLARGVAVYLIRSALNLSFATLGKYFGGRDHSTTMHAYQRIQQRVAEDRGFRRTLEKIASNFQKRCTSSNLPIPESWKTCLFFVDSC